MVVFVEVSLKELSEEVFKEFHDGVNKIPEIQECHLVAGGFDYIMKVRVSDMIAYRKLLGDILSRLPHVRETRTYVVMEEVKDSSDIPVAPAAAAKRVRRK